MPPLLDFLMRPIVARWIGFELYNDTERKLKNCSMDKGQCIVLIEALLHLKPFGFR